MLLATFKLFISGRNRLRELLPGALVAAAGIVALQAVGTLIVSRYIAGASDTYGTFAVVIALLSWFFLVSRVVLLGAELNAVLHNEVWPRSLVGSTPVTDGDRRAVLLDARRVQRDRRIGVAVSVDGDEPPATDAEPAEVTTKPSPTARVGRRPRPRPPGRSPSRRTRQRGRRRRRRPASTATTSTKAARKVASWPWSIPARAWASSWATVASVSCSSLNPDLDVVASSPSARRARAATRCRDASPTVRTNSTTGPP